MRTSSTVAPRSSLSSQLKWERERDYRFAYEWRDDAGRWFRSNGNENWDFDDAGLMRRRIASINDVTIAPSERLFHWPQGRRPDDHPGVSELGL